jgi:hypothetical protein
MLHNITSSSPNSPYASLAIASSPPAMPLPRSPVPPLKLLPREPPNGGGVGERQGKDAAMQEASFVKDAFASFLFDQVKPGREESSSELIPAPSRALPAAEGYGEDCLPPMSECVVTSALTCPGRAAQAHRETDIPNRSPPWLKQASGSDSPKVARYKRRKRIENGCEGTEVLQDETTGLCTWRDVTNSLPDTNRLLM